MALGKDLPDLATLYTRRDQAALKVRATAALVEKSDAEFVAAQDELDDGNEAHARAVRGEAFARLVKALEPAAALDNELIAQGGGFGIGTMIEQAQAAAEKCEQPAVRDIRICCEAANGMGEIVRSVPPDLVVREVASGRMSFYDDRDGAPLRSGGRCTAGRAGEDRSG